MLNWLEKHFSFSRRELTGIAVLGILLLVIWLAPYGYRMINTRPAHAGMGEYVSDIERFLASIEGEGKTTTDSQLTASSFLMDEADYFFFDPNGLAIVEWKRLGLSERQIRTIKNYEAKGGRFRKKEDLKKIYTLHDADYARLEPYIRIVADVHHDEPTRQARSQTWPSTTTEHRDERIPPMIDLNRTDSAELQQLPGIGPVFASRIVRFRDRLGGFHDVAQLMDVYGFDSVRFDGLRDYIHADAEAIRKIPINTADYNQLSGHPLISPKLANAIVQYRKQHGHYRTLEDILGIAIMDEEIFRRIVPYLTVSE